MKFPQDLIDRVRDATNIVDVISPYVQLRQSGGNHQGLCPFHHEKTPSFSVSEAKQVYYCFGCKASGNVFGFIQKYQGMSFPETIEHLAARAGIPIPLDKSLGEAPDKARALRTTFFKITDFAARFYHRELTKLPKEHPVKEYLERRGLSDEVVNNFRLGYAPDAWSSLAEFFAAKNVPVNAAEQLGLIKPRGQNKSGHYDLFRHRLMFPIFSPTNECVGFGGRVLSQEQQPKYLNSPDSAIFHKGKVFYGLDHSAKFIRAEDEAIVVEGYMDWLALVKVGINNVVATLGTALTHDHARLIKRYSNKVLLLFDGDGAGKSAARRSLPILLSEGVFARGLFLPDELDPDEYIQARGAPALRQRIQSAPDLFDLVSSEQWLLNKSSPTGKIQLLDEFAPMLAQIEDLRLRRLYAENLALLANVDVKLVEHSVKRTKETRTSVTPLVTPAAKMAVGQPSALPLAPPTFDLSKVSGPELELLNVMLLKEVLLKEAIQAGVAEHFTNPNCQAVAQRIFEVYGQMPNKFDTLSALLADEVRPVETITRHLAEPYANLTEEAAHNLLLDCIKRVKSSFLRSKSKELVSGLRGKGEDNISDQLEQIMNINMNRRSLNRESKN